MGTPFLIAETPRGGRFGHCFIVPPETGLTSSEVAAYFRSAALGREANLIAVNHQVRQHLPNGAVRQGPETLLLAGLNSKDLTDAEENRLRQHLDRLMPQLEKLVTGGIDWEEVGSRTLIIRPELGDWLQQGLHALQARPAPAGRKRTAPALSRSKLEERTARLIGTLLALAVGALTLFFWFF